VVTTKSTIFQDVTMCSPVVLWYFGGMHCEQPANKKQEESLLPASCWLLAWLNPWLCRWRQYVPLKHWQTSTRLCGITIQKAIVLLIFCMSSQIGQLNVWTSSSSSLWPSSCSLHSRIAPSPILFLISLLAVTSKISVVPHISPCQDLKRFPKYFNSHTFFHKCIISHQH
jgi:hypothetical protein